MHSMGDDTSPADEAEYKARTIKRNDAPMNPNGKYYCNFAPECEGMLFGRKCEWKSVSPPLSQIPKFCCLKCSSETMNLKTSQC